jgi:hypothetical protein
MPSANKQIVLVCKIEEIRTDPSDIGPAAIAE